ncbi:MAG: zinc dependent phospholipase C family protein [Armatimonadetes bacterium]|nr:zinc dependent phospholipase C family protein [Armatimonadota bacterium]
MTLILPRLTPAIGFLGKYLLATGRISWAVDLGFCGTHVACNRQARLILEADGQIAAACVLEAFRRELDLGVCWADSGWGCVHHFYHAKTGSGLLGRAPASEFCARYYRRALKLWRQGRFARAMFFLGAATHLLQDACEPHHANCHFRMGHREYEKWVQEYKEDYLVDSGGIYKKSRDPVRWLKDCAQKSFALFDLVKEKDNVNYYRQATGYLLPLTQRITAGFWLNFLNQAGVDLRPDTWQVVKNSRIA